MENDTVCAAWPEWKIVRRINRGSYGVVYEAERTDHGVVSSAAIKVISIPDEEDGIDSLFSIGISGDASRTYLQKLADDYVNEIRIMESFKGSQNIVSVEDYKVMDKADGYGWDIYIRMELLTPLTTYLSDKELSEEDVVKLGCDICSALERCAQRNVIHRDIKPGNIFINEFGDYKLGDFGIARKLENAAGGYSQKGTYNYMAPEVARGEDYGATVDIYSLGMVLYWLMNRKRMPFLGTEHQLIDPNALEDANHKRLSGEPLPPPCDASGKMVQVILTACDPDPRKRFASARAMKKALKSIECKEESKAENTAESSGSHENGNFGQTGQEERNRRVAVPGVITTFGRRKKSDKPVVIAALLVLLLSLIGGGSLIALRNRGKEDSKEMDTAAAVEAEASVEDAAEEQDAIEPDTGTEGIENEAVTGFRFNYENINGGVRITGCTGEIPNGNLVIPAQLNGYNVLSIGNSAFYGNESIKTVSFPDTTTAIGTEAIEG